MGTKKGQRRKTARRAYTNGKRRNRRKMTAGRIARKLRIDFKRTWGF